MLFDPLSECEQGSGVFLECDDFDLVQQDLPGPGQPKWSYPSGGNLTRVKYTSDESGYAYRRFEGIDGTEYPDDETYEERTSSYYVEEKSPGRPAIEWPRSLDIGISHLSTNLEAEADIYINLYTTIIRTNRTYGGKRLADPPVEGENCGSVGGPIAYTTSSHPASVIPSGFLNYYQATTKNAATTNLLFSGVDPMLGIHPNASWLTYFDYDGSCTRRSSYDAECATSGLWPFYYPCNGNSTVTETEYFHGFYYPLDGFESVIKRAQIVLRWQFANFPAEEP
jgi:hypothetical protein